MVNISSPLGTRISLLSTYCLLPGAIPLFPSAVLSPTCTMLADIFQRKLIGLFTIRLSEGLEVEQNSGAELQIRTSG